MIVIIQLRFVVRERGFGGGILRLGSSGGVASVGSLTASDIVFIAPYRHIDRDSKAAHNIVAIDYCKDYLSRNSQEAVKRL
jgi:hypothetical protein